MNPRTSRTDDVHYSYGCRSYRGRYGGACGKERFIWKVTGLHCERAEAASDVHEWISFTDPTEDRTWTFDATYLMSNHRCIFGEGCQGVLDADATDMMQGCCSYGAHFVDDDDVQTVVRAFINVEPRHMQFYETAVVKGFLDAGEPDSDGNPITTTRLVDDACIFLNRPGFEGGPGCALHIAALEAGARPLDWKPNVCWQVPMRLEHATDETGHVVSQLANGNAETGAKEGRISLVVHRSARGVLSRTTGLPGTAR